MTNAPLARSTRIAAWWVRAALRVVGIVALTVHRGGARLRAGAAPRPVRWIVFGLLAFVPVNLALAVVADTLDVRPIDDLRNGADEPIEAGLRFEDGDEARVGAVPPGGSARVCQGDHGTGEFTDRARIAGTGREAAVERKTMPLSPYGCAIRMKAAGSVDVDWRRHGE